jgi:hypothetical protein
MPKIRFSLQNLLLVVTWCAILAVVGSRFLRPKPFSGKLNDDFLLACYCRLPDQAFAATITEDIIQSSPAWDPNDLNPPVSARAALQIEDRVRKEMLRDDSFWKWGLNEISLVPLNGESNKWCWSVRFTAFPENGGVGGNVPEFGVFILMDGSVIKPSVSEHDWLKEAELLVDERDAIAEPAK